MGKTTKNTSTSEKAKFSIPRQAHLGSSRNESCLEFLSFNKTLNSA